MTLAVSTVASLGCSDSPHEECRRAGECMLGRGIERLADQATVITCNGGLLEPDELYLWVPDRGLKGSGCWLRWRDVDPHAKHRDRGR
jgi:hypothetical protein